MTQESDINGRLPERKDQREIDFPWSLPFILGLFILAGLSIPYGLVAVPISKWREQNFRARMRARGRLVAWDEFRRALDDGGSLIVEQHSLKGPFRWWCTSEDIYRECPLSIV